MNNDQPQDKGLLILKDHRKGVNEVITQPGKLLIDADEGISHSGFRFANSTTEMAKCLAVLDYGINYLQALKQQVIEEGTPPHPQASAEVFDFVAFKNKKVESAPTDTQPRRQ